MCISHFLILILNLQTCLHHYAVSKTSVSPGRENYHVGFVSCRNQLLILQQQKLSPERSYVRLASVNGFSGVWGSLPADWTQTGSIALALTSSLYSPSLSLIFSVSLWSLSPPPYLIPHRPPIHGDKRHSSCSSHCLRHTATGIHSTGPNARSKLKRTKISNTSYWKCWSQWICIFHFLTPKYYFVRCSTMNWCAWACAFCHVSLSSILASSILALTLTLNIPDWKC